MYMFVYLQYVRISSIEPSANKGDANSYTSSGAVSCDVTRKFGAIWCDLTCRCERDDDDDNSH